MPSLKNFFETSVGMHFALLASAREPSEFTLDSPLTQTQSSGLLVQLQ